MRHDLGSVLDADETPFKRVSYWELLPIAFIYGLIWLIPFMGLTMVGCPLAYHFIGQEYERIFVCEVFTATDATPVIIKSAIFCQTIYFILLVWAVRRKSRLLKYSEKTVIYERGFCYRRFAAYPTRPEYVFKDLSDEVVFRYEDIESVNLKISDDLNPRITGRATVGAVSTPKVKISGGQDQLIIFYNFKKGKRSKEFRCKQSSKYFYSASKSLAKLILSDLEVRHWNEIESKISRGEVVKFGDFHICNNYIGLGSRRQKNNTFPINELKEIELDFCSGADIETWDFVVRFKAEIEKKRMKFASFVPLAPNIRMQMGHVDNPHLFLKALAMISIPINLSQIYNIGLDEEVVDLLKGYADLV